MGLLRDRMGDIHVTGPSQRYPEAGKAHRAGPALGSLGWDRCGLGDGDPFPAFFRSLDGFSRHLSTVDLMEVIDSPGDKYSFNSCELATGPSSLGSCALSALDGPLAAKPRHPDTPS